MTLSLIGDIALNGLFISDQKNNYKRFEKILVHLENSFTIANLEVPIRAGDNLNPGKNIHFYTVEDIIEEILPLLNIKLLSLANNHIGDYGIEGVKKTIEVLDKLDILHTGAGFEKKHIEPIIFDLENQKIAFLAYVDRGTHPKIDDIKDIMINYFELGQVISEVKKLTGVVDKIIVSIHWGIDYSHYPTEYQMEISHRLVDSGVDIIMGHHPHAFQPYEEYKNGLIFYSLGGLCFGDHYKNNILKALPKKTKFSWITKLNISRDMTLKNAVPIKEEIGNYLVTHNIDLKRWSSRRWSEFRMRHKFKTIDYVLFFKENYIDRIIEFLFGYYKNPIMRFFELFNYKKVKKMIIDAKNKKARNI